MEPLTEDQLSQLSKLEGHWLHPIANLALASGARRGELLALRWSDLDLDKGTMRIERSLEETKAGGLRFKAPKTEYSVRALSLPPSAVASSSSIASRNWNLGLSSAWESQQPRPLCSVTITASRSSPIISQRRGRG